ncbi:MAG: hypothetical protein DRK00_08750 [Thermoprotei archaeon]|nr:MAG: hypothetical protein DRK00_08750 [Thermoprotei archaeon]
MSIEERIREFIRRVEEESRIKEMIQDIMRRAEEVREVAKEDARRALLLLDKLRADVSAVKASIVVAKGRLRGELTGLRMSLMGLEPELRERARELLEEAREALAEFEDELGEEVDELRETLSELRSLAKDLLRARRRAAIRTERSSESAVVSSIRLPRGDLEVIDLLVEAGVFRSRSEAVAYFTHRGLEASKDLLERVKSKVEELRRIREEVAKEFRLGE